MQLEFLECENNANVFGRRCLLECNQWRLRGEEWLERGRGCDSGGGWGVGTRAAVEIMRVITNCRRN